MQYLQPKPYFTRLGHMIWLVGLFFFFFQKGDYGMYGTL
jgi:hypothetical protein